MIGEVLVWDMWKGIYRGVDMIPLPFAIAICLAM